MHWNCSFNFEQLIWNECIPGRSGYNLCNRTTSTSRCKKSQIFMNFHNELGKKLKWEYSKSCMIDSKEISCQHPMYHLYTRHRGWCKVAIYMHSFSLYIKWGRYPWYKYTALLWPLKRHSPLQKKNTFIKLRKSTSSFSDYDVKEERKRNYQSTKINAGINSSHKVLACNQEEGGFSHLHWRRDVCIDLGMSTILQQR